MKNIFAALRRAPKRSAGLVMVLAAVIVPAALWAWGPDRPTYTMQNAAPHVTFNSITDHHDMGDERNFVRIKEANVGANFSDNVALQSGKTYEVLVYYHNNAKTSLNESGEGIAKDVTARVQMAGRVAAGEKTTISGFISASNATPQTVWDSAYATTDSAVALRYIQGSAKIASSNGAVKGAQLSNDLFGNGVKLGYNQLDGILPGCNEYSGYITYQFTVDKPDFEVEKKVSVDNGKTWVDTAKTTPGSTIQYRLHYKNTGTVQQDNVVLQDTLPENVSYVPGTSKIANSKTNGAYESTVDGIATNGGYKIGSYAPKGNAYFIFSAKVAEKAALKCGENTLKNKVVAFTENGNKSDTADVTVKKECEPTKTPGVSIDKKVDGVEHKEVKLNQVFTYQLVVKNIGETNLTNVKVTDPSPANVQFISADKGSIADNKWSYTIPELKIGQSMSFAIKAKVVKEVSGKIVNTACVDAPTVPGTPDDCDDATVEVPPTPVTPPKENCPIPGKEHLPKDSVDCKEVPVTPGNPETPTELPTTGAGDNLAAIIGVGILIAGSTYYVASRRSTAL